MSPPLYDAITRAKCSRRRSSGLQVPDTSASGVVAISPRSRPTRTPSRPFRTASPAAAPSRVASRRSNAPGAPPRWTCPSDVTRRSTPIRSWCSRKYVAISAAGYFAPSAITPIACDLPRSYAARNSFAIASGSQGISGIAGPPPPPAPPPAPRHEGEIAAAPPHPFDQEGPPVRGRRGLEPIDRLQRDVQRRVHADRDLAARQIVADRGRHAHDPDPHLRQGIRPGLRPVPADDHQGVQPGRPGGGHRDAPPLPGQKLRAPRAPQDGP